MLSVRNAFAVQKSRSAGAVPAVYVTERQEDRAASNVQQQKSREKGHVPVPANIYYNRASPWTDLDLGRPWPTASQCLPAARSVDYLALSLSPPASRRTLTVTKTQGTHDSSSITVQLAAVARRRYDPQWVASLLDKRRESVN